MRYYIAPSYYPDFEIDIELFNNNLLEFCLSNSFLVHSFQPERAAWEWRISDGEHYLEGIIGHDKATIEINGSSCDWMAKFGFFAWSNYPVSDKMYLLSEDFDKVYLLKNNTTIEDFAGFLNS